MPQHGVHMPIILNLIKESLKLVTLGAVGGHAIAPVLLFLALFLIFCLSEPIGVLFLTHKPGSEGKPAIAYFFKSKDKGPFHLNKNT